MMRSIAWMLFVLVLAAGCGSSGDQAEPGPPAQALLTRHDVEPAGKNCQFGGTAIRVGVDRDGDGTLEDGEVDHTDYLCNPATTVLVRKDTLAPSLACPDGGVAVQTGVDTNGNGTLEDSEITQTTQVCNSLELLEGDFLPGDWNDPIKVAALQGARVVVGSLSIDSPGPLTLPALEVVTGDLFAGSPTSVPTLPALRQIGGGLIVATGAAAPTLPMLSEVDGAVVASTGATALDLPTLSKIGGDLGVTTLAAAATFGVLDEVHGELFVQGNSALVGVPTLRVVDGSVTVGISARGVLSLPGLQTIGGGVVVLGAISGLHADRLVSIGGTFKLDNGGAGQLALSLPALLTITGDVTAISESSLTSLDLPQLEQLGGTLELLSDSELTKVSIPKVSAVGGDVRIIDAVTLTTVDVGGLVSVGGTFEINEDLALTTLSVGALARVGVGQDFPDTSILINETALTDLELSSLRSASAGISIENNFLLQTLQLPVLTTATVISASVLESFAAPKLTTIQTLGLGGGLQSLDLGALQSAGTLSLDGIAVADLSGLPSLAKVGSLILLGLTQVKDLRDLSSLQSVTSLWLDDNRALVSLDGLERVTQLSSLRLTGNDALASLAGLRNVTQVANSVVLFDEAVLTTLELTGLVSIGGNAFDGGLVIEDLPALTSLSGLGALTSLGGELEILDTALSIDDVNAFAHRIGR
jgi:hypothetical protein